MAITDQSIPDDAYSRQAKLRFELEGRTGRIRKQMAHMLFFEALGEHTMSGQIQGMLARERTRLVDLETSLRGHPPSRHGVNTPYRPHAPFRQHHPAISD